MRLADRFGFDYGRVRLWGSAMFVAGNVLSGIAVSLFGLWIVAPWLTVVLILNVASVYILRGRAASGRGAISAFACARPSPRRASSWRCRCSSSSSRRPAWCRAAIPISTISPACTGANSATAARSSACWCPIGILGEIALFAASVRVMRLVSPPLLLAMGAAGGMVRWTILAFDPPLAFLFLAQCLHGASFAMSHLGAMYFVLRAVPPRLAATGQSLYAVSSGGLFMGLGAYACGPLYAQFGGFTALLMTAMCAASGLFAFLLLRLWQGGRITAQSGGDEAHDNI